MVHEPASLTRRSSAASAIPPPTSASPFHISSGGDPHHQRAPSLGELHQEMEAEQEASVNRLLQQIHDQQEQIRQLQSDHWSAVIAEDAAAPPTHEAAFYQAETSLLQRENQMLRHRVRELERQLDLGLEAPKEESAEGN